MVLLTRLIRSQSTIPFFKGVCKSFSVFMFFPLLVAKAGIVPGNRWSIHRATSVGLRVLLLILFLFVFCFLFFVFLCFCVFAFLCLCFDLCLYLFYLVSCFNELFFFGFVQLFLVLMFLCVCSLLLFCCKYYYHCCYFIKFSSTRSCLHDYTSARETLCAYIFV